MLCSLWYTWTMTPSHFFPILSCKTKSACWVELVRLLTYVVLLRYDSILIRVFANILLFALSLSVYGLYFLKTWFFLPLSSKSASVHQVRFPSAKNTLVIVTIAIFRLYFLFEHASFGSYGMFLVNLSELSQNFFWNMIAIISLFCSIMSLDMAEIMPWDHW